MSMKAVIMAGGEGRRLKPVTGSLPKPMAPLLGKPIMEHIVELLRGCGVTDIAVALHYNPAPLIEHFGDGSALGVHLAWRIEDKPLGTAGGVKTCMDFIGKEDFLVISGDAVCELDLAELMRGHKESGAAVTLALHRCSEPLRYGCVVPDGEGNIRGFIEKPGWERVVTDLVNTGIYAIAPRAMDYVPDDTDFDFARDLFPLLLEKGEPMRGVVLPGYWCDVGTPEAYYRCCLDALEGRLHLPGGIPIADKSAAIEQKPRQPLTGSAKQEREIPCSNRAALMGKISAGLMEAGAELNDGAIIKSPHCALRISPSPTTSAVIIETASGDDRFSARLADTAEEFVRGLAEE